VSTITPTDEELMLKFQKGDKNSFEILYTRYRRAIFSFLARKCANPDTAGDLLQEVFFRVARGSGGFEHGSRFSTWLYTIARNLAVDEARKASFRTHASLDQPIGQDGARILDRLAGNFPAPDRSVIARNLREDLVRAIAKLPDEQREVFLLREYHQIAFGEIAKIVNAKEGTVKSRMRYALSALKRELEEYEEYAETLQ
jgi:RNA polymerase sigma-70 factor (ECF subfamily)